MTNDVIRWRPKRDVADPPGAVDSRFAYRRNGQTFYSVWPAGCQEPEGNPAKWSEETLSELYEMVETGGDEGRG